MEVWLVGACSTRLLLLPDLDLLVSGEQDGTLRVLDEQKRKPIRYADAKCAKLAVKFICQRDQSS